MAIYNSINDYNNRDQLRKAYSRGDTKTTTAHGAKIGGTIGSFWGPVFSILGTAAGAAGGYSYGNLKSRNNDYVTAFAGSPDLGGSLNVLRGGSGNVYKHGNSAGKFRRIDARSIGYESGVFDYDDKTESTGLKLGDNFYTFEDDTDASTYINSKGEKVGIDRVDEDDENYRVIANMVEPLSTVMVGYDGKVNPVQTGFMTSALYKESGGDISKARELAKGLYSKAGITDSETYNQSISSRSMNPYYENILNAYKNKYGDGDGNTKFKERYGDYNLFGEDAGVDDWNKLVMTNRINQLFDTNSSADVFKAVNQDEGETDKIYEYNDFLNNNISLPTGLNVNDADAYVKGKVMQSLREGKLDYDKAQQFYANDWSQLFT